MESSGSNEVDISSLAASAIGQAIHTAIEDSYSSSARDELLAKLGYPKRVIDNLAINPTDEEVAANPQMIPIYLEQRAFRKVTLSSGTQLWVSGKYDQVVAGQVEDNKSTSAYKYCHMGQSEKSDYAKQQSIYRWLSPDKITSENGRINFIIKDWKKGDVNRIKNYPPNQVVELPVQLMSLKDTERMIISKLDELERCGNLLEEDLPRCADEDLWKRPDTHKYYSDPEKAKLGGRSTKNFDSIGEASAHKAAKGKGVIVTVPGPVKRCEYCNGAPLCTQRLEYI